MRKLTYLLSAFPFLTLFCQCSTIEDSARTALLAGGGALAAQALSNDDPLATAAGAIGGAAAGQALFERHERIRQQYYVQGFEDGQANALKQRFWHDRDSRALRPSKPSSPQLKSRYYRYTIPEHRRDDGVLIAPHSRTIEIIE